MKYLLGTLILCVLTSCASKSITRDDRPHSTIQAYFTTGDPLAPEKAIVTAIEAAQDTILVEAYYLTSGNICSALKSAQRKRDVTVKILMDRADDRECIESMKKGHRIYPRVVQGVNIAHNKVMIIDAARVITGSYNFTENAKNNAENLLVIDDQELARTYINKWWELYWQSATE